MLTGNHRSSTGVVLSRRSCSALTLVLLVLLEQDARLLGHVLVAVHVGEVREDGLDDELVEVVDVLHVARVVHFFLGGLGYVGFVHEPLQDGSVRNPMHYSRRHVELVVKVTTSTRCVRQRRC